MDKTQADKSANNLTKFMSVAITAVCGALLPMTSAAFGNEGHEVVARIADSQLNSAARAAINRILAGEPGASLASIASWADQTRDRSTARWHFVNFPRGDCNYEPERDCPDGQCVVAAIDAQNAVLHSEASTAEKLTALKYLVHFVGDVHQPLHAGYYDDKGGNTYQIQSNMYGKNLHELWDTGLIRAVDPDPASLAKRILASASKRISFGGGAAQWAQESCAIVAGSGFYPGHIVPADYFGRFSPVVEQRLLLAGVRLAAMLNDLR